MQVARYRSRVSGPLLDRIDIQVWIPAVTAGELAGVARGEPSARVRERVVEARERQEARGCGLNGNLTQRQLERLAAPDDRGQKLLADAITRYGLSARAYHRILRMARTIADLGGSDAVRSTHVAEAVQYRVLDREGQPAGV